MCPASKSSAPALQINDLTVAYGQGDSRKVVVAGLNLELKRGDITGLAGESGSGKSTAALAAIGYPTRGSTRLRGSSLLGDLDLLKRSGVELESLWGRRVALLGQNNGNLLNPLRRIGFQVMEPLRTHLGMSKVKARTRAAELLEMVDIPNAERALKRYPHQFSGGQQQRIALALAMACGPDVLILDEPTTGLDVRTQLGVNERIVRLVKESDGAALYISHDLAMLVTVSDDIAIMYGGEIVEHAAAAEIFRRPRHPYTAALLDAVPRIDDERLVAGIRGRPPTQHVADHCGFADRCRYVVEACLTTHPSLEEVSPRHFARCLRVEEIGVPSSARTSLDRGVAAASESPILSAIGLECDYGVGGQRIHAVQGVTFELSPAETLAIVGESGSGKSTLVRALAGLHPPSSGWVELRGMRLAPRVTDRPRDIRRAVQLIFQNPDTSLNPRQTIGQILQRPIALLRPETGRRERQSIAEAALRDVLLEPTLLPRRPHELSGGQRQRVAIARAFALNPAVLLCDEVVSALDVSVAASILELLANLAQERGTGLVFVTHNLAVVRAFADRIAVMKDGAFVEEKPSAELFSSSEHTYTRDLIAAIPNPRA